MPKVRLCCPACACMGEFVRSCQPASLFPLCSMRCICRTVRAYRQHRQSTQCCKLPLCKTLCTARTPSSCFPAMQCQIVRHALLCRTVCAHRQPRRTTQCSLHLSCATPCTVHARCLVKPCQIMRHALLCRIVCAHRQRPQTTQFSLHPSCAIPCTPRTAHPRCQRGRSLHGTRPTPSWGHSLPLLRCEAMLRSTATQLPWSSACHEAMHSAVLHLCVAASRTCPLHSRCLRAPHVRVTCSPTVPFCRQRVSADLLAVKGSTDKRVCCTGASV